jgi:hypothetical protein
MKKPILQDTWNLFFDFVNVTATNPSALNTVIAEGPRLLLTRRVLADPD